MQSSILSTPRDLEIAKPPNDHKSVQIGVEFELDYQIDPHGADFLFNIHAARTRNQRIVEESLALSQDLETLFNTDRSTGTRCMRLHANPGDLRVTYRVTVVLQHHFANPDEVREVPIRLLPADVLPYLCTPAVIASRTGCFASPRTNLVECRTVMRGCGRSVIG